MPLPARPFAVAILVLASCSKDGKNGGDSSGARKRPSSYPAKVVEGQMYVRQMARSAVDGFDRESIEEMLDPNGTPRLAHALCKGSTPVPAEVPKATKYQPGSEPGKDFDTGDVKTGWRCLKFALMEPTSFQVQYRQGSGYKGPARGGPDPGPNGFEASAEADLDGDGGKTTLITLTGVVDEATNTVKLETKPFVAEE